MKEGNFQVSVKYARIGIQFLLTKSKIEPFFFKKKSRLCGV